jgi:hypothetical protein
MAGGSAAAAAAAAEQQRHLREEEEEMTNYSSQELAGEWEFKIVRANTRVFRNPAVLEKLIKEEAQAGWVMLEKFDDSRVRFRRPRSARENDYRLPAGVDPYRTQYGMDPTKLTLLILGIVLGGMMLIFLIMILVIFFFIPG